MDQSVTRDEVPDAQTVWQYPDLRWRLLMLCRQGTPTFVARGVVSAGLKPGFYQLMPMPQFDQANEADEAYEAYKAAVPDRLDAFPETKPRTYTVAKDIPHEPFKHELQYDAESVFWLLLWWAIQASRYCQ